jgi:hypothetical protein
MEYERIAVARKDGSTAILSFLTRGRGNVLPDGASWLNEKAGIWQRPSRESLVAAEVKKAIPDYLAWHRIVEADIPSDREYRDAWHHNGKTIIHDMEKAKEIHRNKIRHARATAFVGLDAEYAKAFGRGDAEAVSRIETARQKWRDAPADPRIAAATTIESLKSLRE